VLRDGCLTNSVNRLTKWLSEHILFLVCFVGNMVSEDYIYNKKHNIKCMQCCLRKEICRSGKIIDINRTQQCQYLSNVITSAMSLRRAYVTAAYVTVKIMREDW